MKMKKLMALGVIAPLFAMTTTSCSVGMRKVTFDEAFNFAIKHYDEYHYLGYEPTYNLRINTMAFKNTKTYRQIVTQDRSTRSYEQVYYLDTTTRDITTTIDTDEIPTLQINSVAVKKVAEFISITNALLGYFESSFTLENEKYLGIYVKSSELGQVVNILGGVFAISGMIKDFPIPLSNYLEYLTSSKASLKLTASCNNLGLLDRAHAYLEIDDLSLVLGDNVKQMLLESGLNIDFDVLTSKALILDIDFIVDYSNK